MPRWKSHDIDLQTHRLGNGTWEIFPRTSLAVETHAGIRKEDPYQLPWHTSSVWSMTKEPLSYRVQTGCWKVMCGDSILWLQNFVCSFSHTQHTDPRSQQPREQACCDSPATQSPSAVRGKRSWKVGGVPQHSPQALRAATGHQPLLLSFSVHETGHCCQTGFTGFGGHFLKTSVSWAPNPTLYLGFSGSLEKTRWKSNPREKQRGFSSHLPKQHLHISTWNFLPLFSCSTVLPDLGYISYFFGQNKNRIDSSFIGPEFHNDAKKIIILTAESLLYLYFWLCVWSKHWNQGENHGLWRLPAGSGTWEEAGAIAQVGDICMPSLVS